MNKKLKELILKSEKEVIPNPDLFRAIANLDKLYSENEYYKRNIEGILCNIGINQNNLDILKLAKKRLETKELEIKSDKFFFDSGNIINSILDIELKKNNSIGFFLEKIKEYNKARENYLKVNQKTFSNFTSYERAITNNANILKRFGRNIEAIGEYDKVLNCNPSFGVALGNKANSLLTYYSKSPYKSLVILNEAKKLFESAIRDKHLISIGGQSCKSSYKEKAKMLKKNLKKSNFIERKKKPKLTEYQQFTIKNNLFLNFDFGYYYDKKSLKDDLFPEFIEKLDDSPSIKNNGFSNRIHFCLQIFNELVEEFVSSRFLYYHFLFNNYSTLDNETDYVYLLDYTKNSIQYGVLKKIYSSLYNSLDKLAHVIFYYLEIKNPNTEENIYFKFLFEDEKFKQKIIEFNSYDLLALHSLAFDLLDEESILGVYKKIRNRLTHSFLNINTGILYNEKFVDFELDINQFTDRINELFLIVKSAIFYFIYFVSEHNNLILSNNNINLEGIYTKQKEVFN